MLIREESSIYKANIVFSLWGLNTEYARSPPKYQPATSQFISSFQIRRSEGGTDAKMYVSAGIVDAEPQTRRRRLRSGREAGRVELRVGGRSELEGGSSDSAEKRCL